jgi:hypothetical protein
MKTKWIYFYDNVTNDTIVVYFYRYVYTTQEKRDHFSFIRTKFSDAPHYPLSNDI